ncbi:MAG: cytochrome b/b6 domain-containing protein [Acidobacteriota bacterium]
MKDTATASNHTFWKDPATGQVRIYVWEWPIRFSHWVMVVSIILLSVTGYYMHSPYLTAQGHEAFVMGKMRFIHIITAYAFLLAIALRIVWFFLGNRWVRIDQYIPTTRRRFRHLIAVCKYYGFMAWSPRGCIGHNPMAGASYMIVYTMAVVEIFTGFTMFAQVVQSPVLLFLFGWVPRVIDIQYLREIHFFIMFGFWMFFIQHVYTAALISIEERSALMDSIFSGYKFVPEEELAQEMGMASPENTAPVIKTH